MYPDERRQADERETRSGDVKKSGLTENRRERSAVFTRERGEVDCGEDEWDGDIMRRGGGTEAARGSAALREVPPELLLTEAAACDRICKTHSRSPFSSFSSALRRSRLIGSRNSEKRLVAALPLEFFAKEKRFFENYVAVGSGCYIVFL